MSEYVLMTGQGDRIVGALSRVPGVAALAETQPVKFGLLPNELEYAGETAMDWNGQKVEETLRGRKFVDEQGRIHDEFEVYLVPEDLVTVASASDDLEHLMAVHPEIQKSRPQGFGSSYELPVGCHEIFLEVNLNEQGEASGMIHSGFDRDYAAGCTIHLNAAYDTLESLILAQACEGVDVADAAYVRGLETALEAIENHFS